MARSLRNNIPFYIKELFRVKKDEDKKTYLISTHYPKLLGALIKFAGDAPYTKKKQTKRSFLLNQRNFINTWNLINESHDNCKKNKTEENQSIYLEEYYIFERLFDLDIRLYSSYLFLNTYHLDDNQTVTLLCAIFKMAYLPNVFGRAELFSNLYDSITRPEFSLTDTTNILGLLDIIGNDYYPLIQNLFCGYLLNNKELNDLTVTPIIKDIIKSELYKNFYLTNHRRYIPEENIYYPLTKKQGKKFRFISLMWERKLYFKPGEFELFYKFYDELCYDALIDFISTLKEIIE